jgi:hypothetical protein
MKSRKVFLCEFFRNEEFILRYTEYLRFNSHRYESDTEQESLSIA